MIELNRIAVRFGTREGQCDRLVAPRAVPQIFISYRHVMPDQQLATTLTHFLETAGFEVFADTKIRMGQDWVEEIDRHLRGAQYFVVLLSAESVRSDMVRREIAIAHKLRRANKLKVLPVRVGFDGELPYDLGAYLSGIQHEHWLLGEPFEPICEAVLQAIDTPVQEVAFGPPSAVSDGDLHILARAVEIQGAPLPLADPRLETGAVGLDSPYYIRRAEDRRISALISGTKVTALVKGPRQVGKTSLLARALAVARERQQQTLYLDFQLIDESHFATLRELLFYFAQRISRELNTSVKPKDVWDESLGAPESLTDFIERAVLEKTQAVLSIVLDEVDRIFQYKFRNAFFGMIRAWHNRRATNPIWNRFNMLIGHSTEPALFIDDINQSPFNVGEVFRLGDFATEHVEALNQIYGCPLHARDTSDLMSLVGGHPYLVRQSFYSLRTCVASLTELKRIATNESGPFGDHLRRHLWVLRESVRLRQALKQVLRENRCSDELDFQRLRAGGILEGDSHESARLRCDLYRRYFDKHL